MKKLPIVSISGASGKIAPDLYKTVEDLGKSLAESGYHILCGGRDGIMEAIANGFTSVENRKGVCLGILPSEHKEDANPWIEIPLPTGIGFARNSMVALMGDAMIVISGGSGTLSEAAFAWQYGKPIGALIPTGGTADEIAGRRLDHRRKDVIAPLRSIQEVLDFLDDVLR